MLTHTDTPTHVGPATAAPAATFDDLFSLSHSIDEADPALDSVPEPSFVIRARHLAASRPTPGTLARLAKAELDIGNRVSAIDAARRVDSMLEVFAEPAATLVASHVLAACGEYEDAERLIGRSGDPSVQDATAPLAARLAAHRGDLGRASQLLESRTDPVSLELAGALALKRRDFHRAIALLRSAVLQESHAAGAYTNLSYAYASVGSVAKAHRAAVTAFSLDPTSVVAGINLTAGLAARQEWKRARRVIDQLIEVHPSAARLWFAKSELYANEGAFGRAIQTLSELQSQSWLQDGPQVHRSELASYRAFLKHQAGRSSRREAYQAIRAAAQRCNYESPYVLRQLADYAAETTDLAEVERALMSLESEPLEDDAVVAGALYTLRAKAELLSNNLDGALVVASDWSMASPADNGAWLLGSFLSLANSDPAASVKYATEGLRRHPDDLLLANNMALALALLRRPEAARQVLPQGDLVVLRATGAAIDISAGRVDQGIDTYDQLASDLERRGAPTDALHVRLWRNAVIARLTPREVPTVMIQYDDADNVYVRLLLGLGERRT